MLRRLGYALAVFAAVLVIGTLGYALIGRWPIFDALYMTIMTMSGEGVREIHPLTVASQVWTMLVIFGGVGSLGFAVVTVTDFMVEGHFNGILERRRMNHRIAAMTGHHIVAGLGRVGSVVAEEFDRSGRTFVVIDSGEEALAHARARGWATVAGDATEEDTLREAGVERASSLTAALDSDSSNVFVTLTARGLRPDLLIVARATVPSSEAKLRRAGADRVITPTEIGGRRMAAMVIRPEVVDYLDVVSGGAGLGMKIEQITLTADDPYVGVTIADAHIRSATGAYVLAVAHEDGSVDRNPEPSVTLRAGDTLVVLGSEDQLRALAGRACLDADVCYPRQR